MDKPQIPEDVRETLLPLLDSELDELRMKAKLPRCGLGSIGGDTRKSVNEAIEKIKYARAWLDSLPVQVKENGNG